MSELAEPAEQHLVEAHRCGRADAVRVVDQRSTMSDDGVHHGVPVTAEIGRDLRHGTTVVPDLERRPPAGPIRDRSALIGDAFVDLDEGHHSTRRVRAPPPLLRPHQPGLAPEARQVDELDLDPVMQPHTRVAARTRGATSPTGDRDPQELRPVADAVHVDVGQPDQQLAHARRVGLQQGLLEFWLRKTHPDSSSPCPRPGTPLHHHPTLRSEAPVWEYIATGCGWHAMVDQCLHHVEHRAALGERFGGAVWSGNLEAGVVLAQPR